MNKNWHATNAPGGGHPRNWYVRNENDETIAHGLTEETARLIAAAPKLLKACEALLKMSGGPEGLDLCACDPRTVRGEAVQAIIATAVTTRLTIV
jgi:hypothetical protein